MDDDADDAIRRRAHQLWEQEGRPDGKHEEHWRRAASEFHGLEDLPGTASSGKNASGPKASAKPKSGSRKSTPQSP